MIPVKGALSKSSISRNSVNGTQKTQGNLAKYFTETLACVTKETLFSYVAVFDGNYN